MIFLIRRLQSSKRSGDDQNFSGTESDEFLAAAGSLEFKSSKLLGVVSCELENSFARFGQFYILRFAWREATVVASSSAAKLVIYKVDHNKMM